MAAARKGKPAVKVRATNAKHSSEHNEHYTPPEVIEAARVVMNGIDLDPASCEFANRKLVRARNFFDRELNGFLQTWCIGGGATSVFLNPPGGLCEMESGHPVIRAAKGKKGCTETGECGIAPGHAHRDVTGSAKAWWAKLAREVDAGRVREAVFVAFTVELLQSAQGLSGILPTECSICIPKARLHFLTRVGDELVAGDAPTHANAIVYIGPQRFKFRNTFYRIGECLNV